VEVSRHNQRFDRFAGVASVSGDRKSARPLHVFLQLGIVATSKTSYDTRLGPAHSSRQTMRRAALRFFQQEGRMWGFLIGLYIAVIIYPFIEEWQEQRANKADLANMRRHSAMGHRWDATRGQWIDK
jgi:hypothetical protein